MRAIRIFVVPACVAAAAAANAQEQAGKFYVNPQYGYTWLDDTRPGEDDDHWALGFGKHISERWGLELNGLNGKFDFAQGAGTLEQTVYSLDVVRMFGRGGRISPFATFGVGHLENDFGPREFSGEMLQAGAGLLVDLTNNANRFNLQLRPEIKGRHDWADSPFNDEAGDYLLNLGLLFAFGGSSPASIASAEKSPPAAAAAAAAPAAAAAAAAPPADSDGDGVRDPADQCPGTARGVAVNNVGCPRTEAVTLHGVEFEFNSATLAAASRSTLDEVAADLKRNPRLTVELQGHTDNVGNPEYNNRLSQQRADAVRTYLTGQGVAASQLVARGYGESRPIADNATDAGRVQNRRVAMAVLSNPGNVEVETEN
jgi:OOP family OmpA-OmpF porin